MGREERVLSIDVGTQSVRALVFDACGRLVDSSQVVYDEPYRSAKPGWAEQDADYYWNQLCQSCRKLWEHGIVTPQDLSAMSVTTQRGTLVSVDERGRPLRPAILWLDRRRAGHVPQFGRGFQTIIRMARLHNTIRHLQAEAEINWLFEQETGIWKATRRFLLLSGYLAFRLTGEFVDSVGNQVGYVPFDYRKQRWSATSHWKWKAFSCKFEQMPDLIPVGTVMGNVTVPAATDTRLPQGLPVIAAASDKACEVLGAGCLSPHQGCIGYGTTATITVNCHKYIEPVRLLPAYPSAVAGEYNLEVQVFRGFWLVSWFKEQFAHPERELASRMGCSPEQLLDELADKVPPGALGLMLQPFWSPGVRYPGPEAKGAIIGFGDVHRREHVYRAILEGIAYAMRAGREQIERRSGTKMKSMMVCGGGSRSNLMLQITADVFGMPTRRPAITETSGLGAAVLAAVGIGIHKNVATAVKTMTRVGDVFEPNQQHSEIYSRLYDAVYRKIYRRLRPFYGSIQSIVGYPEIPRY